jgi:AcrR family transcriptional regulator
VSRDTRTLLIAAAAELLDQGGPAAVTLRDVGRLAGVSHNAPYKHFADKEELLAAVAARELSRQARTMNAAQTETSPRAVLRGMMRSYARWARAYPQRFKLTFGAWKTGNAELGQAADASRRALIAIVEAAQAKGEFPKGDPERLMSLLLSVAHGAADLALGGHLSAKGKGHADPEDLLDDLFDHLSPVKPTARLKSKRKARGKR